MFADVNLLFGQTVLADMSNDRSITPRVFSIQSLFAITEYYHIKALVKPDGLAIAMKQELASVRPTLEVSCFKYHL